MQEENRDNLPNPAEQDAAAQDAELEPNKNSGKDLWLFFIFLDIIALCVLGFFVYTSFFDGLSVPVSEEFAPQPFLEEVYVENIKDDIKPAAPSAAAAAVAATAEESLSAAAEQAKPAASKPAAQPAAQTAQPKKQSVSVSGTGRTRTVVFKYFGNAKTAAVVGGFTMRKPVAMKKYGDEWRATLVIYPGEYRYKYLIDGKEIPDPNAEKQEDGRSVLIVK
ncbi:MAG: glycogen-binding domain-containing protein [Elusimicrobiota bacterium]|jgi:hypothetical protein|nr:glycogen-binding domain-containing protein [Elusimicrobiota bacterium]